jgi:hypothetical protein
VSSVPRYDDKIYAQIVTARVREHEQDVMMPAKTLNDIMLGDERR